MVIFDCAKFLIVSDQTLTSDTTLKWRNHVPTYNVIIILKTKLSSTRVLKLLIYKIFVEIVMNINWKILTADVYSIKLKTGYQEQILNKNSEEKKHTTIRLNTYLYWKMRNSTKRRAIRRVTMSRTNASHYGKLLR